MTLTEQWKKGELPDGFYYVYLKHLEMFDIAGSSTLSGILERGNEDSTEVLAPVPSYEEWQKMKELRRKVLKEKKLENKKDWKEFRANINKVKTND